MSLSPINDFSEQAVQKYKHRWSALSRLLHADRSFSGGERHCAFLNLKGEGFANISAASGFDFAEDGRALVTEDWDFDGDLDIWVTARTAPRVRLLKNESQNTGDALFIRLQGNGTTTNPEAIGARCEIWLEGDERPLTRSVRAGDSFLSQASSWLHFGLGHKSKIARVVVHWPAGKSEEFTGLKSGGRYLLTQGHPKAKQWKPPTQKVVTSDEPLQLPHESEQARIVLPTPVLLPLLQSGDGDTISNPEHKGPLLVNLWSRTCSSCLHELKEWTQFSAQFQTAGLKVLALNADEISQPGSAQETQKFLNELKFPYLSLPTNEETIQRLDLFQRSFLDRWLPLPVPCSFLVDSNGKAAVIYKGPVSAKTILADLALLGADGEDLRKEATPFSGRWADPPPSVGPKKYVAQLLDHKQVAPAERYYERYLEVERKQPDPAITPMIEALKTLAHIASQRKKFDAAVSYLEEAGALVSEAPDLQIFLKNTRELANKSNPKNSLQPLIAKVAAEPTNGQAHLALADAYRSHGEPAKAVASYKNALRNEPKLLVAAGKLGWILATHPSPEIREPKAALEIANRLMSLNGGKNPNFLDLQGIALAANGDYATAAEKTRAALVLLTKGSPYHEEVSHRLELYQKGEPYLEGAPTE